MLSDAKNDKGYSSCKKYPSSIRQAGKISVQVAGERRHVFGAFETLRRVVERCCRPEVLLIPAGLFVLDADCERRYGAQR